MHLSRRPVARLAPLALLPLLALPALFLAASPAAAGPSPGLTVSEVAPFHYAGPLAAPRTLRLSAVSGGITATASTDGKLDFRAVVVDGDPARVRVVTREEAGGIAVCVLFADESPDGCRLSGVDHESPGKHDHQNGPTVDLVARVPAGVSLTAGTLNGAVKVQAVGGEIHASTLNGDVSVSAATVAEATTLNGNVEATFAAPPPAGARVSLTTNNGNVRVTLPAAVDTDIDASTIHGEITTSFPMAIETTPGGFGPKNGHARLGKGGSRILARSINGNVELRGGA